MMCGMMGVEPPPEPPKPAKPPPDCQSCGKACTKPLRCGRCASAVYCSAACQKEDWRFHQRICKKPAADTAAAGAPAAPGAGAVEVRAASGAEQAAPRPR